MVMIMKKKLYYTASDIAEMLGVSKGTAYGIIRKLNAELAQTNYIVVQGRVSKAYFDEKWYGLAAV